ncbi:hypothetical protein ACVINW_003754 [Bradyrhizobium sp. USDA 4461]
MIVLATFNKALRGPPTAHLKIGPIGHNATNEWISCYSQK